MKTSISIRPNSIWVYLIALIAYLPTAARTVQEADAGQFLSLGAQCLKSSWPLAHPPGYPIETAIACGSAWLATVAAPVPAALWLAWASALFTALAAGLAYSSLTRLKLASPVQALFTVAALFLSRDVWRAATTQEPLGLGLLTLTAGIFLPLLAMQTSHAITTAVTGVIKVRWLWLLSGAAFGLGFANHHTTAMALPGALWCLWQASLKKNSAGQFRLSALGYFLIGAVIGALPIVLILIKTLNPQEFAATSATGPVPAFDWVTSVSDPLGYLLRTEFGTFSLAQNKAAANLTSLAALQLFLSDLPKNLGWFGIICAGHGFIVMIRNRKFGLPFYLPFSFTLFAGMAFLILNKFPADTDFIDIIRRFHPFVLMTFLPFMAAGLSDFWRRLMQWRPKASAAIAAILGALLAGQIMLTLPDARRDQRTFAEEHFIRALNLLPPGSLLVAASDEEIFGLSYAQVALGIRPDVRILNLLEWSHPIKRQQVLARIGIDPSSMINLNRGELIGILATREPLWIIDPPIPPRPDYLASAPCIGPYLILDLRKNPEIKQSQAIVPSLDSRPWLASDQSLLDKYLSCRNP